MTRDIHIGFMAGEMIKSGYFNEEIQYFGFACWHNDDIHYIVSVDEIYTYSTFKQMIIKGIVVTPVMEIVRRLNLNKENREHLLLVLQDELKQKLLETYPREYFLLLTKFINEPNQNTAFCVLDNYREVLSPKATEEKWNAFGDLVRVAMNSKLLTEAGYNTLLESIDLLPSPLEKTNLYNHSITGFAYLDHSNQTQYYTNGYWPETMEKKLQLTTQKVLSTPILEFPQTMTYNSIGQISVIRNEFLSFMNNIFNKDYFNVLRQIQALPAAVSKEQFSDRLKKVSPVLHPKAISAITGYGFLWHVM